MVGGVTVGQEVEYLDWMVGTALWPYNGWGSEDPGCVPFTSAPSTGHKFLQVPGHGLAACACHGDGNQSVHGGFEWLIRELSGRRTGTRVPWDGYVGVEKLVLVGSLPDLPGLEAASPR